MRDWLKEFLFRHVVTLFLCVVALVLTAVPVFGAYALVILSSQVVVLALIALSAYRTGRRLRVGGQ